MAGIRINLDLSQLEARLKKLDTGTQNLKEFYDDAALLAYSVIKQKFRDQGPGWAPRKESSKKRRREMGKDPSGPLLQMNGKLRQSVISRTGAGSIHEVDSNGVTIGSNLVYARIHQLGGTIKQKRRELFGKALKQPVDVTIGIPARPYLPTEEEIMPGLLLLLEEHLQNLMDG